MKDSRITLWTNPTLTTTGTNTLNGPTVDLWQSGALSGGTSYGTDQFGVGFEILQATASGTAQVGAYFVEVSSDASTWRRAGFIGTLTSAAASTTYRLRGSAKTQFRYFRISVDYTGTGTSNVSIYADDYGDGIGSHGFPLA